MSEGARPQPAPLVPLPARLAVLLSGRGSNFEALADGCDRGEVPARIVAVLSDRAEAAGLEKARAHGLAAHPVPRGAGESRPEHEARIDGILREARADLVCLAGYMRLLSPEFVERWRLRIVNVHPALLPSFPGTDAQAQALRYGVKVSGATVHLVDAGVDSGPIVEQEAVTVFEDDTIESLSARILAVEHRIYPLAVRRILEGGWILNVRSVQFPPSKIPL